MGNTKTLRCRFARASRQTAALQRQQFFYRAYDKMIAELFADNQRMAGAQRAAIEVCDEARDTPTGNLLQEILDETARRIWFLFAVSTGGQNELQQPISYYHNIKPERGFIFGG